MTDTATKRQTFDELIGGRGPVLVDFFAVWCGPCKAMKPVLHELKAQLAGKLTIIQVDIDKSPAVTNRYQIQGVPTLILFKGGRIVWRQSGVVPAAQLAQILAPYL